MARLEVELRLAQDRAGDALTLTEEALGRFDLAHSPRYAWPLVTAGARACGAAVTTAARDPGLAGQARGLLARLRARAEKLPAAENVLRYLLGSADVSLPDPEVRLRAVVALLDALASSELPSETDIDALLAEARMRAANG